MISPHFRILLGSCFILVALTPPAYANVIAPFILFCPGFLPLTLAAALPATVLAAVVERPFVEWAGVQENARSYSLQANLVSLLIGYLSVPFVVWAMLQHAGTLLLVWMPAAVVLSILSEGLYYRLRVLPKGDKLDWRWLIWGNIVSSLVLSSVSILALLAYAQWPRLGFRAMEYEQEMLWASASLSVVAFVVGFFVPAILGRWRPAPGDTNQAMSPGPALLDSNAAALPEPTSRQE